MTITQLRYFFAICEYGKIRIAAEQLHVSEPTISVSIKRLEEEAGTPLFLRDRNQLVLTEKGKFLRRRAAELLAGFDLLEKELRQRDGVSTVIRLGIPYTVGEYVCSQLISEFLETHPTLMFEQLPLSSGEAAEQVENRKSELAICDRLAVRSDRLEFVPLVRSSLLGCVDSAHPLAGRENVTPRELEGEKLILLNEKALITRTIIQWFRDNGAEPNIFMYSTQTNFTISMARRHRAVPFFWDAMLKENRQIQQAGLSSFTLSPPLSFVNGIVRNREVRLSREAQIFFDFCRRRRLDAEP